MCDFEGFYEYICEFRVYGVMLIGWLHVFGFFLG